MFGDVEYNIFLINKEKARRYSAFRFFISSKERGERGDVILYPRPHVAFPKGKGCQQMSAFYGQVKQCRPIIAAYINKEAKPNSHTYPAILKKA